MKKVFKVKEKCPSCNGTGVYIGFAERDGFGVVCSRCEGTGCREFIHEYEEFKEKKKTSKIKRILECNPGIGVGINSSDLVLNYESFGGMGYEDWFNGKPFPFKSEMRQFTCPAWWYQSVNYKLKPDWDECIRCGSFSGCKNFKNKDKCWERFDKEMKK